MLLNFGHACLNLSALQDFTILKECHGEKCTGKTQPYFCNMLMPNVSFKKQNTFSFDPCIAWRQSGYIIF